MIMNITAGLLYISPVIFLVYKMHSDKKITYRSKTEKLRIYLSLFLCGIVVYFLSDAAVKGMITIFERTVYHQTVPIDIHRPAASILFAVILSVAYPHLRIMYTETDQYSKRTRFRLYSIFLMILAALLFLSSVIYDAGNTFPNAAIIIGILIIMLAGHHRTVTRILQKEKEQQILLDEKAVTAVNQAVYSNYLEIRRQKHDMNHFLLMILGYLENDQIEEAEKQIRDRISQNEAVSQVIYTHEPVIDSLLSEKISILQCAGIRTKITVNTDAFHISLTDLGIILGNILDNAIEHTSGEQKEVIFSMLQKNSLLFIHEENTIDHPLSYEPGYTDKTDQDAHGFGLISIRKYAEKYGGTMEYYEKDSRFCIDIFLNVSD